MSLYLRGQLIAFRNCESEYTLWYAPNYTGSGRDSGMVWGWTETGLRVPNDENKPIIDLNWYFYFLPILQPFCMNNTFINAHNILTEKGSIDAHCVQNYSHAVHGCGHSQNIARYIRSLIIHNKRPAKANDFMMS